MRRLTTWWVAGLLAALAVTGSAQQPILTELVRARSIQPPDAPLPPEADSARVTRFSFIAYGDTRSQVDGLSLQPDHGRVVDAVLVRIASLASTPFAVRFVVHSGDAVARGVDGAQWNISFSPLVEKLTRAGNVPYFLAAGNHDVALPPVQATRALGLHNMLAVMSRLMPAEGSPRRLNGYPTYAFGYGNLFAIVIDSNIATDQLQLAWVTDQLEHLDRSRYRHVIAVFHHPVFSSGPHGGSSGPSGSDVDSSELTTAAMRELYLPLFRKHRVRMTLSGHDHLLDHWVERYTVAGASYRRDDVVSGGGGAPIYTYGGEPSVQRYVAAGAAENVRLEHMMKPGITAAENPHHFVVVQVDGDRLSLDVVGTAATPFTPYNGGSHIDLNDAER